MFRLLSETLRSIAWPTMNSRIIGLDRKGRSVDVRSNNSLCEGVIVRSH
jgi:hypothetical protein